MSRNSDCIPRGSVPFHDIELYISGQMCLKGGGPAGNGSFYVIRRPYDGTVISRHKNFQAQFYFNQNILIRFTNKRVEIHEGLRTSEHNDIFQKRTGRNPGSAGDIRSQCYRSQTNRYKCKKGRGHCRAGVRRERYG